MSLSFALLTLSALAVPAAGAQGRVPADLAITVVPTGKQAGAPMIDHGGKFHVAFKNLSKQPIRLWSEDCKEGYGTLSFRVDEGDGPALMCRATVPPWAWRNARPKMITIAPGETFRWDIELAEVFGGDPKWKGAPEPNGGKLITLTAVFDSNATDPAQRGGVWTGRLSSEPLKSLVVNPKLQTPNEYLWAGCPKQAMRMMKADRTWITKVDAMQCTPLHHAARFGFMDVARWLLDHGADVNARAYNYFMPLHLTTDPAMAKLLIANKADINARSNGGTPLQTAASNFAHYQREPELYSQWKQAAALARVLLDADAAYDMESAACLGDAGRVRALLEDKAQAQNKGALREAVRFGRTKIVELLLKNGADARAVYYGGLTISSFAVQHADVLKLLLDAGADPKAPVDYKGCGAGPEGSSLLHEAAAGGFLGSVKLLLARGAEVNKTDASGATALHAACLGAHLATVEFLLHHRADATARMPKGWTPMSLAASQVRSINEEDDARYRAVIRALERAGVALDVFAAIACDDVARVAAIQRTEPKIGEIRNPDGCPALHVAVMLDRREIAKRLLDKGCNPDVRSRAESGGAGGTALLSAAFWDRLDLARMLIECGAAVNAKSDDGTVPLHEAVRLDHVAMARLLLEHGADVNAKGNDGKRPLDWAGWSGRQATEMIRLLRRYGATK
jgi:ankyrin repeat protein